MKDVPVGGKVNGGNSFWRHSQDLLDICCGMLRIGDEVRCPFGHYAVSGPHHLLFGPGIDGKEKWNEIMNSYNHRTLQQRSCIKRTVKKVELVLFFVTREFERRKRRILPRKHWNSFHRKPIQSRYRITRININHQFTTRTNKRRQQPADVSPYSGLVVPAGIKSYTHCKYPLLILDRAILLAHISLQRFLCEISQVTGKRRVARICDDHVRYSRSILCNQLPD